MGDQDSTKVIATEGDMALAQGASTETMASPPVVDEPHLGSTQPEKSDPTKSTQGPVNLLGVASAAAGVAIQKGLAPEDSKRRAQGVEEEEVDLIFDNMMKNVANEAAGSAIQQGFAKDEQEVPDEEAQSSLKRMASLAAGAAIQRGLSLEAPVDDTKKKQVATDAAGAAIQRGLSLERPLEDPMKKQVAAAAADVAIKRGVADLGEKENAKQVSAVTVTAANAGTKQPLAEKPDENPIVETPDQRKDDEGEKKPLVASKQEKSHPCSCFPFLFSRGKAKNE